MILAFLTSAGAARPEQGRSVLEVAGFFELLGEVLDLRVLRYAFGLRDAGPLDRWDRSGCRRFRLGLRIAPQGRVPDQELHAMVTQGQVPLAVPRLRQFRFLEAHLLEHVDARGLERR